jgi:MFS family permease
MVGAAVLYGVVGMLPLILTDLYSIMASRVLLGVFEAFVMVAGIALIGDLFTGAKRARLLALQTTMASTLAFIFNNVGGFLGDISWRVPYATYSFGFILAILAAMFLWEPSRRKGLAEDAPAAYEPELQPLMISLTCVLAVVVGFVFMATPVHFSYLFVNIGITEGSLIGPAYGFNSIGVVSGTLLFGWGLNGRMSVGKQICIASIVMAAGFYGMSVSQDYTSMVISGFINGLGGGLLLPSVVTWNMRLLPTKIRGFGAGAWQSGFFLGNVLAASLVVWIGQKLGGGRAEAFETFSYGLIILAIAGLVGATIQKSQTQTVQQEA